MSTGTPRGIEGARRTNERAVRVRAHRKEEETIEPSRRDGPAGARGAWREGPGRPVLAWARRMTGGATGVAPGGLGIEETTGEGSVSTRLSCRGERGGFNGLISTNPWTATDSIRSL